jgi:hypothetical protein
MGRKVLGERHRWQAVRGHLHELSGDLPAADTAYADAARRGTDVAERDPLVRQAARARAPELCRNSHLTELIGRQVDRTKLRRDLHLLRSSPEHVRILSAGGPRYRPPNFCR